MTDWPELPITLSSRIEGWRLELINRRDERSCAQDILDRMPSGPGGGHCMVSKSLQQFLQASNPSRLLRQLVTNVVASEKLPASYLGNIWRAPLLFTKP